jgi:hypothetical protein
MHSKYRMLIGGLLWAALQWRPDICYITTLLGRFTHNPSFEHYDAAIIVFRYCLNTKRLGICFRRPSLPIPHPLKLTIVAYYDSDWAKDWDRISVSGAIYSVHLPEEVTLAERAGVWPSFNTLFWSSKKQNDVALSTADAESRASAEARLHKELKWTWDVFGVINLHPEPPKPFWFLGDNDACNVNLAENRVGPKTRHYEIDIQSTRMAIKHGRIKPGKIKTDFNRADCFTKLQDVVARQYFIDNTMMTAEPNIAAITSRNQTSNDPASSRQLKRKVRFSDDNTL